MEGVTLTLYPEFGYVIFTMLAAIFMLLYLGAKVGLARKKHEVPYPKMYTEPYNHVFNCIQRAHQNTVEIFPVFLALLIFGGLACPKVSAAAGMVWIASRFAYARGYSTGDPEKRRRGGFGYIGLLLLLVCNICLGLRLLGVVTCDK